MTHSSPDLGYIFASTDRPSNPGHPRLTIHLRGTPTGRHFDPRQALIPVLSHSGDLETLKIVYPWSGQSNYQVAPGRIILHDAADKTAEAFSFSGDLGVESSETLTTCTITSTAPILNLSGGHQVAEALAEEVEILLAEQHVRFSQNPEAYGQRLIALDPLTIYTACLFTLREKLKRLPAVEGGPTEKLTRLIYSEVHFLQDRQGLSSSSRFLSDLFFQ